MFHIFETDKNFAVEFTEFLTHKREGEDDLSDQVRNIIQKIRQSGDDALLEFTEKFDRFKPKSLAFTEDEIEAEISKLSEEDKSAIALAAKRITSYHQRQLPQDQDYTDEVGARLGWHWSAIRSAGIYVPGGLANYPSSVLMNAIPAKVAGVTRIDMCVPCPDGKINPMVLLAAKLSGVHKIYKIGGAQAIAALAYGTKSILPVDIIAGPGNAYVAEAKRQVFGRVGIDMIAGPSEVLIIADEHNDPDWIAMDLLSQCEHDADAQAIFITDSENFAKAVEASINQHLKSLERKDIAEKSWQNHGAIIIAKSLQTAAHLSNLVAPEHLQICTQDARALSHLTTEAGAIFLGAWSPEAIGDYVAGPNHVLPTSRTARFASGLGVLNFMKRSSVQEMNPESLKAIGPAAVHLAKAEKLQAHGLSVQMRLDKINGGPK